ncbi:MAG: competence/damage-inducible protein A [Candidatus Aminicenantes bacterium]|nr:competence/damage-inducible protein A [Candidatus Aminicenantes bacterium]
MNDNKKKVIEIIAVGSEFLTPHYQDTNSLYLASRLNELGLKVSFKSIVGDDRLSLLSCFTHALKRADMIFVIGGLGPTADDITREIYSEALGTDLEFIPGLLKNIKNRFDRRGLDMASSNKKQAFVIQGAQILENKIGTAPGLWIDDPRAISVLLPGPPMELKTMFDAEVFPKLEKYKTGFQVHKILKMVGITESRTESLISDLYPEFEHVDLSLLAYPGQIEIHITSHSVISVDQAKSQIQPQMESLTKRLDKYIFSQCGEELEEVIGKLLIKNKKTLSVAESCTGGFLGHRITNVPGSSQYFLQGIQAYSNKAKIQLLGVDKNELLEHGAVSDEVARLMAEGTRNISGADFGLAVTGIAGPGGGTKEKPVGLVFTSLSWDNGFKVEKNQFLGDRSTVKTRSTQKAMDMLRRHLLFKEAVPDRS